MISSLMIDKGMTNAELMEKGGFSANIIIAQKPLEQDRDFPSAKRFRWPHVQFSEMDLDSSCASEDMIVSSSSPLPSKVQMFSFSK